MTLSANEYREIAEDVIDALKELLEPGEFDKSDTSDLVEVAVEEFIASSEEVADV